MELHREDLTLLERLQVQAEVLVPVVRALEAELGVEEAHRIVGGAIGAEYRRLAARWLEEEGGDAGRAFARLAAFTSAGDPLDVAFLPAQAGEVRFDVTSCAFADFFRSIGAPDLGFLLSCSADGPMAEGIGVAFERTTTLMQGHDRCDFRYRFPAP